MLTEIGHQRRLLDVVLRRPVRDGFRACGSVCDTRTMYGDLVVMTDVAAFMMTIGFFIGRHRRDSESRGVRPNPAGLSILS